MKFAMLLIRPVVRKKGFPPPAAAATVASLLNYETEYFGRFLRFSPLCFAAFIILCVAAEQAWGGGGDSQSECGAKSKFDL